MASFSQKAATSPCSLSPFRATARSSTTPFNFDPFRYSRIREASIAISHDHEKDASETKVPAPNLSFVSTGSQFLPFGHGKHACPGRYLVDFELKMILAYILLNYEIEFPKEYQGKRPGVTWMAEVLMPSNGAKIGVGRRVDRERNT
jgi:cytochrome P450